MPVDITLESFEISGYLTSHDSGRPVSADTPRVGDDVELRPVQSDSSGEQVIVCARVVEATDGRYVGEIERFEPRGVEEYAGLTVGSTIPFESNNVKSLTAK